MSKFLCESTSDSAASMAFARALWGSLRLGERAKQRDKRRDARDADAGRVLLSSALPRQHCVGPCAFAPRPGAGGQPTALDRWTASGRRARPPRRRRLVKDGLRSPRGQPHPGRAAREDDGAPRRDVWRGQTAKSRAKGERRTTRKLFRTPDIRIKYMRGIYSGAITAKRVIQRERTPWIWPKK